MLLDFFFLSFVSFFVSNSSLHFIDEVFPICLIFFIFLFIFHNPLASLSRLPQLPCGHEYCKSCVEELRQKGVDKSCPLCRKPLPPGPDKLLDLGLGMCMKIKGAMDRSRPGVDEKTPWLTLSNKQQCEMDQAVAMLREAADQGHPEAQAICGALYQCGWGVAQDDRLALVYYEKGAQQGDAACQADAGHFYREGRGCEQSFERAVEWFEKAAVQGHPGAMTNLGLLYLMGQGVPHSNFERGVEWLKRAVLQGYNHAQFLLAVCYKTGRGVAKDYLEARRLYTLASAQGFAPATEDLPLLEETIRTECPLLGKRVMITGTGRKDLNGRVGVARSFDDANGRYVVRLHGVGEVKSATMQELKVKPTNLKSAI